MAKNELMSYDKSRNIINWAIAISFFAFVLFVWQGLWSIMALSYISSYTSLYSYYETITWVISSIFWLTALLYIVSFSINCAALHNCSKELVKASMIIQNIISCTTSMGFIAFYYFYSILQLEINGCPHGICCIFGYSVSMFFNISCFILLYKHWYKGRFFLENIKELLHERNRNTFETYKLAYANGSISKNYFEYGMATLKKDRININNASYLNEKVITYNKRIKFIVIPIIVFILGFGLSIYVCTFSLSHDDFSEAIDNYFYEINLYKQEQDRINSAKNERKENEFFNKLYYKTFTCNKNGTTYYLSISPNYSSTEKQFSCNLPHAGTGTVEYWDYEFNADTERLTIYRKYSSGEYNKEYIIQNYSYNGYYKYHLVDVYCCSNKVTYTLCYYE